MSILTGPAIRQAIADGHVVVDPPGRHRVPQHIGPNSIDLHLAPVLMVYGDYGPISIIEGAIGPLGITLDARARNATSSVEIPEGGLVLQPGILYLGSTVERTFTPHHVPYVDGRSSVGRLGVFVHCTAGRGDVGFDGNWTLEISCVQPVQIYAGIRIAQLTLHEVVGPIEHYAGRYQHARGVEASKLHEGWTADDYAEEFSPWPDEQHEGEDRVLGAFADAQESVDEVAEMAMRARERKDGER